MAHYQTRHGYNDDELVSALQKDIRRGNERRAMYWALELGGEGASGFGQLASRLMVIAYEDVGLGNPAAVLQACSAIRDMRDMYRNDRGEWRMALAYVVLLLCRSEKSRISCHFLQVTTRQHEMEHFEIPDYALDMHTSAGALMGRTKGSPEGVRQFLEEGKRLSNESDLEDGYRDEARELLRERAETKK
jgi:replication-associated recombination protein RarA